MYDLYREIIPSLMMDGVSAGIFLTASHINSVLIEVFKYMS